MEQSPIGKQTMEAKHFVNCSVQSKKTGGKQVRQWSEFDPGVLIRFDDVKVSRGVVMCKPTWAWFQYHQLSFCTPEVLFISKFT